MVLDVNDRAIGKRAANAIIAAISAA